MNLTRLVYKTHKWLAVGAGALTFVWFLSGIVMTLPGRLFQGSAAPEEEARRPANPGYRDVAVSLPQVIAAVEAAAGPGVEITEVRFRRLLGRLLYEVSTARAGTHLVDAVTGDRVVITEDLARQIAARRYRGSAGLGGVSLLRSHDSDYRHGSLPAYRVATADPDGTAFYVAAQTGEAHATNRRERFRQFLAGTHTFEFLRPRWPNSAVRLAMLLVASVGLLMSGFGLVILCVQLRGWRGSRRAAV